MPVSYDEDAAGFATRFDMRTQAQLRAPENDMTVTSIEASVDMSLAPYSEAAPVRLTPAPQAARPAPPPETCWAHEETPAVYEQVMGEVQVVQAEIAPDGTVIRPPIYRRAPVPRVVQPRGSIRFEAPCPEQMTPDFISSVQRALAARGYFAGNVTGMMDPPTSAAIRKYQEERGFRSAQLSIKSARSLGLAVVGKTGG